MQEIVQIHQVLGYQVDSPQTSIGVGGREGQERVGEVVAGKDVRESGGKEIGSAEAAIPVTEDGLHDHHGEVVG